MSSEVANTRSKRRKRERATSCQAGSSAVLRSLSASCNSSRVCTARSVAAAPALFVAGPSGVGKSRLMREVRHRVQLSGLPFVEANCYEGSFAEYGPMAQAFRHLLRLADGLGATALTA